MALLNSIIGKMNTVIGIFLNILLYSQDIYNWNEKQPQPEVGEAVVLLRLVNQRLHMNGFGIGS